MRTPLRAPARAPLSPEFGWAVLTPARELEAARTRRFFLRVPEVASLPPLDLPDPCARARLARGTHFSAPLKGRGKPARLETVCCAPPSLPVFAHLPPPCPQVLSRVWGGRSQRWASLPAPGAELWDLLGQPPGARLEQKPGRSQARASKRRVKEARESLGLLGSVLPKGPRRPEAGFGVRLARGAPIQGA